MRTDGTCKNCGKNIRYGISLCKECKHKVSHHLAIVSQNKTKLKKLLEEKSITIERLDKFILYANNIIQSGKNILIYKDKIEKKTFKEILKFGIFCFLILLSIIII